MASPQVKRRYDSSGRRARAEASRRAVLAVAREQFLSQGYAATTVPAVARAAGVSTEAVYKGYGSKAQLLMAVFHAAIAGDGAVPAERRADEVSERETDPAARLRAFGGFVGEVTPRVAPLMLLVRAGAEGDAELAAVWSRMNRERLDRMRGHARRLAAQGHLRPEVGEEEAADVLWAYTAPDLYDLLCRQRGWSPQRFGRWVGEAYVAALLPR
jgi:AcrR family transcriptional regulator